MSGFSLYVHIPYCQVKCPYCDFNSYAAQVWPEAEYVGALCAEMRHYAQRPPWNGGQVKTIFFGGGTPSLFAPASIATILETASALWCIAPDSEVTLEANPGTTVPGKLTALRAAGINRMSFGVQSFVPHHLRTLGRIHSAEEARIAVRSALDAGFVSVSVDLIFALPNQTLGEWESDLAHACALDVPHISAYNLTYEDGTPFHHWRAQGKLRQLPEETEVAMFTRTQALLGEAGYHQYEISNYARPGSVCRHNLNYWQGGDYLGIGAGAHSYRGPVTAGVAHAGRVDSRQSTVDSLNEHPISKGDLSAVDCELSTVDCELSSVDYELSTVDCLWGDRWSNEKNPGRYLQAVGARGHARAASERLDAQQARGEFVFLGLRCRDGVAAAAFRRRFGAELDAVFPHVRDLVAGGVLRSSGGQWQLTRRGVLLADSVFATFL